MKNSEATLNQVIKKTKQNIADLLFKIDKTRDELKGLLNDVINDREGESEMSSVGRELDEMYLRLDQAVNTLNDFHNDGMKTIERFNQQLKSSK